MGGYEGTEEQRARARVCNRRHRAKESMHICDKCEARPDVGLCDKWCLRLVQYEPGKWFARAFCSPRSSVSPRSGNWSVKGLRPWRGN